MSLGIVPLLRAALQHEEGAPFDIKEMILHHLADSNELELPVIGAVPLPHLPTFHIGPIAVDLSITKHVVFMFVAAILVAALLIIAARDAKKAHQGGAEVGPKGAANVVEAFILFLRDEVALKNIGHGGEKYVPYIVSVFFFVLFCNMLGLVPWGASATGNISVTAGMKALGAKGYLKTIFYAPEGMSPFMKAPMYLIMTPVEFLSKLTKPFALAIRLYANMTAGHAVVLALTGLIISAFLASVFWAAPAPLAMAVGIMVLEIFVAVLQAYIFAMLSSVFIGLIRHAH
jgi:F-type H+-transporting ATPase subunit a